MYLLGNCTLKKKTNITMYKCMIFGTVKNGSILYNMDWAIYPRYI